MEKFVLKKEMLKSVGDKILFRGLTTDAHIKHYGWGDMNRKLKFVVKKGFVNDWCIYVEGMDMYQTFEEVARLGNKVTPEVAMKLIECSNEELLERYRI
jgi:hypothetical protein